MEQTAYTDANTAYIDANIEAVSAYIWEGNNAYEDINDWKRGFADDYWN
ncbi:hypothetical protein JCM16418A_44670 [Paenibacillus pini]|nr:hypothetical protein [Paenibacillus pini]